MYIILAGEIVRWKNVKEKGRRVGVYTYIDAEDFE